MSRAEEPMGSMELGLSKWFTLWEWGFECKVAD